MEIKAGIFDDVLECPLNSDLNSCNALKNSDVNSCPSFIETLSGNIFFKVSDDCPLKKENIIIKLGGTNYE